METNSTLLISFKKNLSNSPGIEVFRLLSGVYIADGVERYEPTFLTILDFSVNYPFYSVGTATQPLTVCLQIPFSPAAIEHLKLHD